MGHAPSDVLIDVFEASGNLRQIPLDFAALLPPFENCCLPEPLYIPHRSNRSKLDECEPESVGFLGTP